MRDSTKVLIDDVESDRLLTTGEAAKLMGVSRQHIVDLCDRGDLPYTTVGSHRRIRRADLQLAMGRTRRLSRDQRRSLWLGIATAGRIVHDPEFALSTARDFLKKLGVRNRRSPWDNEWRQIIDRGEIEPILEALTSPSPRNRELRQNSPFAGLLSPSERDEVLSSFRDWSGRSDR